MWGDVRYALRGMRRNPVLAGAATATLAISMAANTAVFSLVNSILLRPLPYPGADRIQWISERLGRDQLEAGVAADYYSLRESNRVFDEVGAYEPLTLNWSGADKPEQVDAAQATPSFFRVMGSRPMLGRYLAEGEEGRAAPAVAVVSYAFWRDRLGADRRVVGTTITLDRLPHTVIGVMPQGFDFPHGTEVWRPWPVDESSQRPRTPMRPMRLVNIVARAKARVDERQIAAEMQRLTGIIRGEYPKAFEAAGFLKSMSITAVPLQRRLTGDLRPALAALSGAVGLVLLIACANMANLYLARAAGRQREFAIRMALGSGRWRMARQALIESLTFAVPGGVAGALAAWVLVAGLNSARPLALERYSAVTLDWRALAFTAAATIVAGLASGVAPALASARAGFEEASRAPRTARLRSLLVVAELSISLVLLIGAGLLGRSFVKLASVPTGFRPENLLTMRVNLTGPRYATAEGQLRFYDDVLGRLKSLGDVRDAAVATDLPLTGGGPWQRMGFQIAGRAPLPIAQRPSANDSVVSPEFFRTMGIPLKQGRLFGPEDNADHADAIVVNEAFVRKVLPGEMPLGRQVVSGRGETTHWTIVGVVGDTRGAMLEGEPAPEIYRCTCQGGNPFLTRMRIVVRTAGEPAAVARDATAQVFAVDRDQPVFDVKTMEQRVADALAPQRFNLALIGAFAAIAMLLAAAGVYGVMSYLVSRRTREIGIRMALGAQPRDILRDVTAESLGLAAISIAVGLAGGWALTRYAQSLLYGVTAFDPPTFAVAAFALGATVMAATVNPAKRALSVDPASALRDE